MQGWPNFISVTQRNIICVWVCRELQPLLGLLLMRDCHSWVFSLKVDVARKSASQQINQSVLPEVSQGSRLGENPSDRRVYHGNSCIVEGHKSWHSSSQDELQFVGVRYGVWNAFQNLSKLRIWSQLRLVLNQTNNTLVLLYIKKTGRHGVLSASQPHRMTTVLHWLPLTLIKSNLCTEMSQ